MTTLSPSMRWPPSSVTSRAVRRMWITGVCQRMVSCTRLGRSDRFSRNGVLVGMTVQREKAAAHGVAGRVVAADDQQAQRAHELRGGTCPGGLAVGQHRQQVERRRRLRSAHRRPMYSAMRELGERSDLERTGASGACTLATATSDHQVSWRRSSNGKSNSVASIIVVSSIDTRSTQSNVSRRAARPAARAVRSRMVGSRWARLAEAGDHHPALVRARRRVHADEARTVHVLRLVFHLDAAELGRRGVDFVVHLDGHDVLELRDRPVGAVRALGAVVDRRLPPQPREVGPPPVLLVQAGIGDRRSGPGERRRPRSCPRRSSSARSAHFTAWPAPCPAPPWRTCR